MIFVYLLACIATATAGDTTRHGTRSLRLPIRRSPSTLETRDGSGYGYHPLRANVTQKNYLSPYTVELAVGTPPQLVYPAIDIFANNLWLNPDCGTSISFEACCANGKFNPSASTTASQLDCSQPWQFSTLNSGATGCYIDDYVQFAGTELGYTHFGIANQSWGETAGRLGLGFGCRGEGDLSIVDQLKSQGLIATRQFSIALGSANPSAGISDNAANVGLGELLFSGLNTRKYAGELRQLYSHPGPQGDARFYVTLTAIGFFDPSSCISVDASQTSSRAFFDFTTIVSYLPWEYMETLNGFFPDVTYNFTEGVYQVPCYHRSHEASIDFYFDALVISVPLRDFVLEVDELCYLGAVANVEDEAILGQSFLRGAYTAFDLDEEIIYMAHVLLFDFNKHYFQTHHAFYSHDNKRSVPDEALDNYQTFNTLNNFEDFDRSLDDLDEAVHKLLYNSLFDSYFDSLDNLKEWLNKEFHPTLQDEEPHLEVSTFLYLTKGNINKHAQNNKGILRENKLSQNFISTVVGAVGGSNGRVLYLLESTYLRRLMEQRLVHANAAQHASMDFKAD
ncbi:hypothetical protein NUW58_g6321 [Xylaria curta]|uniref:Uncharacterized protein n=1 Tax=Xylaria curta TaxID=42375 RepID=A0ACC1NVF5_9PEZI|nr:hypothetical protein NUW58_g6321 [Xylaria curta]